MNNPQIIDQLERGPEEFDNIPVEITGNDIQQESKSILVSR